MLCTQPLRTRAAGAGGLPMRGTTLIAVTFERTPTGRYTKERLAADFTRGDLSRVVRFPSHSHMERLEIVADPTEPGNKVMRIAHTEEYGRTPRFAIALDRMYEEATFRYKVRYGPNEGGTQYPLHSIAKMPGLAGFTERYNTQKEIRPHKAWYLHADPDPDGPGGVPTLAFSVRSQNFRTDKTGRKARLGGYTYWADMRKPRVGQPYKGNDAAFIVPGKWHEIALHVVMNTPGAAGGTTAGARDGVMAVYLDGTKIVDVRTLRFRDDPTHGINSLNLSTFLRETVPGSKKKNHYKARPGYIYYDALSLTVGAASPR